MKRSMDPSGLGHHANKNDFYAIKDDQVAQSTIYAQTMANGFKNLPQNLKVYGFANLPTCQGVAIYFWWMILVSCIIYSNNALSNVILPTHI
jgi:hypothetical protein